MISGRSEVDGRGLWTLDYRPEGGPWQSRDSKT